MGNSGSRDVIQGKLDTASKTGVLNLSKQEVKSNSPIWTSISAPDLAGKIKVLDLSCNPLKSLPAHILLLEHLKTLHISKCNLQRLPNLSTLIETKKIELDNNDLEETTIGPLPVSLTRLNLSFNHIIKFPSVLNVLVHVQDLDLSNNRLENIEAISMLIALQLLNLDENHLVEIPESFSNLKALKKISLKKNMLIPKAPSTGNQSIPAGLFAETAVDTIDLEGNTHIKKADVMKFDGVEIFLERRRKSKDKAFAGGAMSDYSMFNID